MSDVSEATVVGLVLAAGRGRRLGRAKVELTLDGTTFLERAVAALRDGGCDPVLVTADREHAHSLRTGHRLGRRVAVLEVDQPEQGMGRSLRDGLSSLWHGTPADLDLTFTERVARGSEHAAVDPPADAVVVTLVDTPLVGAAHVARLVASHRDGATVAACTWDGARRTPVLLARAHWTAAAALAEGDTGARAFLAAHPELVTAVPCDDLGPWRDVDVAADVDALGAGWIS